MKMKEIEKRAEKSICREKRRCYRRGAREEARRGERRGLLHCHAKRDA